MKVAAFITAVAAMAVGTTALVIASVALGKAS